MKSWISLSVVIFDLYQWRVVFNEETGMVKISSERQKDCKNCFVINDVKVKVISQFILIENKERKKEICITMLPNNIKILIKCDWFIIPNKQSVTTINEQDVNEGGT